MDFMSVTGPTRFYFGASYGSAVTAVKRAEEQHIMLSYETANNTPWDMYSRYAKCDPSLFIDNGAYSLFSNGKDYDTSAREYLEYVKEAEEKLSDDVDVRFTLRDVTCDDESLEETGQTVKEHQRRSVELHKECLDAMDELGVEAEPYTVLQGQTVDEYLEHMDMHSEAGTLQMNVGIGSRAFCDVEETENVVTAVDSRLSRYTTLHGYGITPRALQSDTIRNVFDTVDSSGWSHGQYSDRIHSNERMFHVEMKKYLDTKRELHAIFGVDDIEWYGEDESTINPDIVDDILDDETGETEPEDTSSQSGSSRRAFQAD